MADVITRFKLETSQFDSKLRDTAKALQGIAHQAELGGKDFNNFNQKAIETARALGTVQSGANNTKDKLRDLVGSYNDAAKAYNSLTETAKKGEFGQAMSQSLTQLQQRIRETKEELYGLGDGMKGASGGGLFDGDKLSGMLQVFGGNLMTKGAGMVMSFAGEMKDMVAQGIELARAGEGIRIAFERLNKPGLLDNLREATHGTVTDLELMKAAVKFNDFKLPVEELGTMLAFAQQKAKDTGQSVDYMVDSIVTGLGRKSLMILDNLGLSAAEIKEKMKDTGDMTKAVGAIIREQMAKAGDYVETAADRASKANVSLQNKMEELGRKFGPLEQASSNLWTSIKIGIMDIVGGPLTEFINKLTEAGRLAQQYGVLGGTGKVGRMINNLSGAREGNRQSVYQQQQEQFWRYINPREQQIRDIQAWQRGERGEALQKRVSAITDKYGSLDATKIRAEVDAAKKMLNEYIQGAKAILEGNPVPSPTSTTTTTPTGGANGNTFDASKIVFTGGEGFKAEKPAFEPMMNTIDFMDGLRKEMGMDGEKTRDWGKELGQVFPDYVADPDKEKRDKANKDDKETKKLTDEISTLTSGLSSIAGGLKSMGIDLPAEVDQVIGVIQGVTSVIEGVNAIISIFSTTSMSANTAALIANTAALNANSVMHFFPFANGGVVPTFAQGGLIGRAAGGMMIPGNSMSGDRLRLPVDGGRGMIGVNSGELILNRAQQGVIASQLEGGVGAMQLSAIITGEQLRLVLNNNGRRTGRGEYVTTNFR